MIANQKLVDAMGNEVSLYPRKTMNITQGVNDKYSHEGSMAIDDAGEDSGIDNGYAPVTVKCSWKDAPGGVNGVNFQSVRPVHCPDDVIRYVTYRFVHDNDISDIVVGHVYAQGTRIFNEGTAGRATGNHNHIVVGNGLIEGQGLVRNIYGIFEMKNELNPVDVFYINGTILKDTEGYAWKTFTQPTISYQLHVQNIGNTAIKTNFEMAGTVGQGLRSEAVRIIMDGVKYRPHIQDNGWLGWVNSGTWAGSMGVSKRLECIEITAPVGYLLTGQAHVANVGWQDARTGATIQIGTVGQGNAIEAIKLSMAKI